jgi:adenylate cyclase
MIIQLGVATGSLIGGVIGTTRLQYDVWGKIVNTASRIESIGEGGAVTICSETFNQVSEVFECVALPICTLKGMSEPQRLYKILRERRRYAMEI